MNKEPKNQPTKTTIVFPLNGDQVLLGMKKRGFGANWWNGFGGKLEPGESFEQSAQRETLEEVSIEVSKLQPVARLLFYFEGNLQLVSLAYTTDVFTGEPEETEEMRPQWFSQYKLPFKEMWPGDDIWIPDALKLKPGAPIIDLALYFGDNHSFLSFEPADEATIKENFGDTI
jgi:8-oxo-dGTP diphosphatase/2-hydroxy-dATP diphosphatase